MWNDKIDKQTYIQSQYGNSPTIKALLQGIKDNINPNDGIQTIYDNIINIDTARGVGLDYWGRILGATRQIFSNNTEAPYAVFGFKDSGLNPFNQGVFATVDDLTTGNRIIAVLEDETYRSLLKFKALANITTGDLEALNKLSKLLFNSEDITVTNIHTQGILKNGDYYNTTPMRVRWLWRKDSMTNIEKSLFENYIIICLAAGVGYELNIVSKDPLFGFYGSGLNPFNQGNFGTVRSL